MTIHKEGYASIALVIAVFTTLLLLVKWLLPTVPFLSPFLWAAFIFFLVVVLQFFRNPKRTFTINDNQIIAPADGKVVVIEDIQPTEYFSEPCTQISIFMSPINVHINRYPCAGKVIHSDYFPGLFLVAWHPKSSTDNERTAVMIERANGSALVMKLIAGALARRIVKYSKVGDEAKQCEEMGFIKFGSRVDLIIPKRHLKNINVKLDEVVWGGQTVIAEW